MKIIAAVILLFVLTSLSPAGEKPDTTKEKPVMTRPDSLQHEIDSLKVALDQSYKNVDDEIQGLTQAAIIQEAKLYEEKQLLDNILQRKDTALKLKQMSAANKPK